MDQEKNHTHNTLRSGAVVTSNDTLGRGGCTGIKLGGVYRRAQIEINVKLSSNEIRIRSFLSSSGIQ